MYLNTGTFKIVLKGLQPSSPLPPPPNIHVHVRSLVPGVYNSVKETTTNPQCTCMYSTPLKHQMLVSTHGISLI